MLLVGCRFFFFFQAEDGIRDGRVTGVQTCALPISVKARRAESIVPSPPSATATSTPSLAGSSTKIGRASCRERVEISGGAGSLKKKKKKEGEERRVMEKGREKMTVAEE